MVYMPCLACRLNSAKKGEQIDFPDNDDSLTLDLSGFTPEERERYEAIRRAKLS
jgi:hypothetical protein